MKAWLFSDGDETHHIYGREPRLGVTHTVEGPIIPGEFGLHASRRAIDALLCVRGTVVWRVEIGGTIVPAKDQNDQHAASERTYTAGGVDVSDTLRRFARKCAFDVVHLWPAPDIVVRFLETGDESILDDAWPAVWHARDGDKDALWFAGGPGKAIEVALAALSALAASDAMKDARKAANAAWWSALAAAWAAANSEAARHFRDDAMDDALAKQDRRLEEMLIAAIRR